MKNIPLSNKGEYGMQLLHKTREFLRRMRIKAYFYEKYINGENDEEHQRKETYGFKSKFNPPPSSHLAEFEKKMVSLVNNLKFRKWTDVIFERFFVECWAIFKLNAANDMFNLQYTSFIKGIIKTKLLD